MTAAGGEGEAEAGRESESGGAVEETARSERAPQVEEDAQVLDADLDEVVEELVVRVASHFRFSGPLPSPDVLQGYEEVLPGLADRVVTMAEEQSGHRMTMERRLLDHHITRGTRGQVFGLVIALTAIGAGTALILNGKAVGGLVTIIVAIGGIVSAFILGAWRNAGDRAGGDDVENDGEDD